jgi:hypothetical protein
MVGDRVGRPVQGMKWPGPELDRSRLSVGVSAGAGSGSDWKYSGVQVGVELIGRGKSGVGIPQCCMTQGRWSIPSISTPLARPDPVSL